MQNEQITILLHIN